MKHSKNIGRLTLVLESRTLGADFLLTLTGGQDHIGAAALAAPDSEGHVTVSVMTAPGHKEEEIAMRGARAVSKALNRTVLLSAGIHLDNISAAEIQEIESGCAELIEIFIQTPEER